MKSQFYFIKILACLLFTLCLSCEDSDGDISPIDVAANNLTKTWEVGSVLLDNFDVTVPSYENFAILFREDGSYFAVDADPAFTESGSFWRFIDNNPNRLEIGGVEASLSFSEDVTALTLISTAPGKVIGSPNRVKGLSGEYEFRLVVSSQVLE